MECRQWGGGAEPPKEFCTILLKQPLSPPRDDRFVRLKCVVMYNVQDCVYLFFLDVAGQMWGGGGSTVLPWLHTCLCHYLMATPFAYRYAVIYSRP